MLSFQYSAQTPSGHTLDGVVRAADVDAARDALEHANLRVVSIEGQPKPSGRPLRGADFFAFNQQLAHLAQAGLPIESGLRLIAHDMRRGRMATSINAVADELERGVDLPQAFAQHQHRFPKLYSQLVEAGVATNRFPAVLLNLGRHLELMQRLRGSLWRASAYPLVVLISFVSVMAFVGIALVPQFAEIYEDFDSEMPMLTIWLLQAARYTLPLTIAFFTLLLGLPLLALVLRTVGLGGWITDHILMRLPLIGPALNRNLMARWCDMLRVAVSGGMDLPAALNLAGQAVGSHRLQRDTQQLIDTLEAGLPLDQSNQLSLIPASVPASIQLASEQADLAALVGDLATIYEQQADLRLHGIMVYLSPALLIGLGLMMGIVIVALFLPLVKLMQSVM